MTTTKIDHYAEAERLLTTASAIGQSGLPYFPDEVNTAVTVAAAQVHATLALADAQAREADADEIVASAVDKDGGRLRVAARPV